MTGIRVGGSRKGLSEPEFQAISSANRTRSAPQRPTQVSTEDSTQKLATTRKIASNTLAVA